ncbi:hypothetical protein DsansV1_C10g0101371 [Dioscorea sansibarensis]
MNIRILGIWSLHLTFSWAALRAEGTVEDPAAIANPLETQPSSFQHFFR